MNGGSIDAAAEEAVRTLTSLEPKLELGGQPLQFSAHKEQVRSSASVPLSSALTVKQDRLSLKSPYGNVLTKISMAIHDMSESLGKQGFRCT